MEALLGRTRPNARVGDSAAGVAAAVTQVVDGGVAAKVGSRMVATVVAGTMELEEDFTEVKGAAMEVLGASRAVAEEAGAIKVDHQGGSVGAKATTARVRAVGQGAARTLGTGDGSSKVQSAGGEGT